MDKPIILFDGVCNLCNGAVKFIIKHDTKNTFLFTSLQSVTGQKLLADHNLPTNNLNSFILIDNNKAYVRSTGVLMVAKKLNGLWRLLYVFFIVPKFIRDAVYNFISTNRYKWFGKQSECIIPTTELKARFLN